MRKETAAPIFEKAGAIDFLRKGVGEHIKPFFPILREESVAKSYLA
jgi:hypothetical protein